MLLWLLECNYKVITNEKVYKYVILTKPKMVNDLVKIVRDTEFSLTSQPSKYATQLELFVGRDEKVLAKFLIQERDEKSHYGRYEDWEMLVGKSENYLRPKKYMEEQRQKFLEVKKQVKDMLADGELLEMGVSSDTVAVFGDFPAMAYRMLDMETKLYESVVAYAKQIGDERGIKPLNVVKTPEGRDEVYRRIFRTREQFEWYNNTSAQIGITVLGAIYNMMESLEPKIREVENIPIIGWFAKRKINKARKQLQLPPKEVAKSFLTDEIAYDARRAERIYSGNSGNA